MIRQLIVGEDTLDRHFSAMARAIAGVADGSAGVSLTVDWDARPVVAGLDGDGCEPTSRNRGAPVRVAPWLLLKPGLWVWLGYREEWAGEAPLPRGQRAFSFRAASLTVHFGYRNDLNKPQMFRMEWSGWARWTGMNRDPAFQAGNAAHPHWQFDALESLQKSEAAENASQFLDLLKAEQADAEPREFSPGTMTRDDVADILTTQKLSRIHFPSAAHWWRSAKDVAHAHAPSSPADVQDWLQRSLVYLGDELLRLT